MTSGVLEGTWEEIIQHSSELMGRRVRVTLLDEAQKPGAPNQAMLDVLRMIEKNTPERTMTTGEDTEELLRAVRSGAMYGNLDEDQLEDYRQSAEYLRRTLDEARLSKRLLSPAEPETITPNHAMLALMQDLQDRPGRMTSSEDTEELLRAARSGVMYGEAPVQPWGLVPIFYDPVSTKGMPIDIKTAVEAYLAIIRESQYPQPISVTKIEVWSWIDPENGYRHWTVTHWLDAPADEAMAYWDALSNEIEQKLETLAPQTADLVRDEIATNIQWKIKGDN